ncbi:MAG: O-antigen ligase family protein [Pseudomonadota bacterium]
MDPFRWNAVLYFYAIYIGVMLVGGLTGTHTSIYGAAFFLFLLYARYWQYLIQIKFDFLVYCVFLCILLPVIPLVSFDEKTLLAALQELLKYLALHLVILLGLSMPLTPISRAAKTWVLYIPILTFLAAGYFWDIAGGRQAMRVQGFLPNPNGFALTAMMLLFITNQESPRFFFKHASKTVVLVMVLLSRTSGALLGYMVGTVHSILFAGKGHGLARLTVLLFAVLLGGLCLTIMPVGAISSVDRTLEKMTVAKEHLDRVVSGKSIDFYGIIEKEGDDVTSGLWRIFQWHRILTRFAQSAPEQILFGHGIGTTDILFQLKAHNDYLRLLLETGVFGLMLNLTVWIIIYRRMAPQYRWVVVMIAVFCITENNYDHFPAMSLLVFYMLGADRSRVDTTDTANATGDRRSIPWGATGR